MTDYVLAGLAKCPAELAGKAEALRARPAQIAPTRATFMPWRRYAGSSARASAASTPDCTRSSPFQTRAEAEAELRGHIGRIFVARRRVYGLQQTPNDHLTGRGCTPCSIERRSTFRRPNRADLIGKARLCHPLANYGHDKFIYVNSFTRGLITCSLHGDFEQFPADRLSGHGCRPCSSARVNASKMATRGEVIAKAKARHQAAGCGYDKVAYADSYNRVTITCPSYGDFEQIPNDHLAGRGCPPCGWESRAASNTYTQDEFITKAKAQHPHVGDGYDKFAVLGSNHTKRPLPLMH